MKHVLWILLVVCSITVFGGFAEPANAQVSNGSISGTVTDAQGAGVADATVKVINKETKKETETTSDSVGLFRLNLLQPSEYRLEITKPGFNKVAFDSVAVSVGADRGMGT